MLFRSYDYCEELLSQIKSYLKEVAEGNIYRYIGVEFIIILEQLSEGQLSLIHILPMTETASAWCSLR